MAKRKHHELAVEEAYDVVSDVSGFGGFELIKDCYHAHPIWKTIRLATAKGCSNRASLLSQFPQGRRSKGVSSDGNMATLQNGESRQASTVEENTSQYFFTTYPRKPRNTRSKRKAKPSDCEVISEHPLCYSRQSRRLRRSTTGIQKLGKLGSEKFESYMETVWRRFPEEKRNAFTCLDSLWFSLYSKEPLKAKVLSWIKKKDIFSKKYVFVPIVQWGHWFLLIFCHFGETPQSKTKSRCMLLLDSLQKANSTQLEPGIRRFVVDIFKTEERPEKKGLINKIPLLIPKVPQQKNGEECGFYVLHYINKFLESNPDNFTFSKGNPHFMKEDWFTPEDVECFVQKLDSMNTTSERSD
ncbi:hypothetical protein ACP275_02G176100 [Erythranthe tilingii]